MKQSIWIFATALLFPIGCIAADKDGNYEPKLMDSYSSCESFIVASDECKQLDCGDVNLFNQWIMGYMTAYNRLMQDTSDIVPGKDLYTLDLWLEKYCKQYPSGNLDKAAEKLTIELYPSRLQKKPKE